MTDLGFHEKLLDGAEVEWKPLSAVAEIKRGNSITKKNIKPGDIPVIAGGRSPAYYHNESNRTDQTIVVAGSGAYAGFVSWWEEPIFVSDAFSVKPLAGVAPRYCFHWLTSLQERIHDLKSGGGVPHVYPRDVAPLEIPIPCPEEPEKSLAIQGEIVRILDSFTKLTAELTAELELRKKQYNHYRDQLLTFEEGEVEWKALGDVVATVKTGKLNANAMVADGDFPFFTCDAKPYRIDTYAFDTEAIIVSGNGSQVGHINYYNGKFNAYQRTYILADCSDDVTINFLLAYLRAYLRPYIIQHSKKGSVPYITKPMLEGFKVPVPAEARQNEITGILNKFDTLTNSLSEGLPREIELRQKQYEYYRDLLLSFPKPAEAAA